MTVENHYFDMSSPLYPYTHSAAANPGTMPPSNALRGDAPEKKVGFWPCEKNGKWVDVEDHRGKEGYVGGERKQIKELGPLPDGWSDTPPPPTPEEELAAMQAQFTAAIDAYMNKFAQERGYDSMASAASYAGDEDPQFGQEGAYCKTMRSRIYRAAWDILDAVLAGQMPMPPLKEVLAELPVLAWPEVA